MKKKCGDCLSFGRLRLPDGVVEWCFKFNMEVRKEREACSEFLEKGLESFS